MQDLLTTTIDIIAISFAVLMALDFVNGLRYVAQPAQFQNEPQIGSEAIARCSNHLQIAPTTETFEQSAELPDPWLSSVDIS